MPKSVDRKENPHLENVVVPDNSFSVYRADAANAIDGTNVSAEEQTASAAVSDFNFSTIRVFPPGQSDLASEQRHASPEASGIDPIQREAASGDVLNKSTETLGLRIQREVGSGSALGDSTRGQLEQHLGADFSSVRVHTDSAAQQLSQDLNANAFTTGSDIFFGSNKFNPNSSDGMQLLAHEATHVVQQASGAVSGTPTAEGISISDPSDSFEQAASVSARDFGTTTSNAQAVTGQSEAGSQTNVQREVDPNRAPAAIQNLPHRGAMVIQRSITGDHDTSTGKFHIDMKSHEDALTATGASGLQGTINFMPKTTAPYGNKIGLIQIVKLTNAGGANVDPASMPTTRGPSLRTAEDKAKGVEGGFFTDVLHEDFTQTPSVPTKKGDALAPHYPFSSSGGQVFGYKRSDDAADIKAAELFDGPGTTDATSNLDFSFETVAKSDDSGVNYGALKWAFGVHAGKVVSETVSVADSPSATFDAALEKHRDFYVHEPVTFYFDFDSDQLNAAELGKIDPSLLDYITRTADVGINLTGHADLRGGAAYNRQLAQRRTQNVEKALRDATITAPITQTAPVDARTTDFTDGTSGPNADVSPQDAEANRRGNRQVTMTFSHVAPAVKAPAPGGTKAP
jgi:outer membrane protein OmpA-like peptidoglycan-associated protein